MRLCISSSRLQLSNTCPHYSLWDLGKPLITFFFIKFYFILIFFIFSTVCACLFFQIYEEILQCTGDILKIFPTFFQIFIEKLNSKQTESQIEVRGPPATKAYDQKGNPTKVIPPLVALSQLHIYLYINMYAIFFSVECIWGKIFFHFWSGWYKIKFERMMEESTNLHLISSQGSPLR